MSTSRDIENLWNEVSKQAGQIERLEEKVSELSRFIVLHNHNELLEPLKACKKCGGTPCFCQFNSQTVMSGNPISPKPDYCGCGEIKVDGVCPEIENGDKPYPPETPRICNVDEPMACSCHVLKESPTKTTGGDYNYDPEYKDAIANSIERVYSDLRNSVSSKANKYDTTECLSCHKQVLLSEIHIHECGSKKSECEPDTISIPRDLAELYLSGTNSITISEFKDAIKKALNTKKGD